MSTSFLYILDIIWLHYCNWVFFFSMGYCNWVGVSGYSFSSWKWRINWSRTCLSKTNWPVCHSQLDILVPLLYKKKHITISFGITFIHLSSNTMCILNNLIQGKYGLSCNRFLHWKNWGVGIHETTLKSWFLRE